MTELLERGRPESPAVANPYFLRSINQNRRVLYAA